MLKIIVSSIIVQILLIPLVEIFKDLILKDSLAKMSVALLIPQKDTLEMDGFRGILRINLYHSTTECLYREKEIQSRCKTILLSTDFQDFRH